MELKMDSGIVLMKYIGGKAGVRAGQGKGEDG